MKRLALALLPLTAACVPSGHLDELAAPQPLFDPVAFFTGHTQGVGKLKIVFSATKPTLVEGHGRMEGDTLILDQRVKKGDEAPTTREWRLTPAGPGRWTGTLTDASGPVTAEVSGNRLHIAFKMKGGTHAEQWLYLKPGGTVAINRMVVTKFGLPVASLDETITRLGD